MRVTRLAVAVSCLVMTGSALAGCGSSHPTGPAAGGSGKAARPASGGDVDQAAAVAAGPVGRNLPHTPTLDRIRGRGVLLYAGARDGVGFSQLDPTTGKISGFDAGMAQLLAKYLLGKPSVKLGPGNNETREALLNNDTVDVAIETYTITPERLKIVNFAGPYYMAAGGIAVAESETAIHGVGDLSGKKVATESGTAQQALLKAQPKAEPVLFDTVPECVTALAQGRVQAVTLNNASLTGNVVNHPGVKMLDATFGSNPFGIGIAKKDPAFTTVVNQFLKAVEADGTWKRLYDETVGKLGGKPAPTPPAIGAVPGA
ncbi:transporter substrate-binding domain-containing protein [Streptomyces sp. TS71-3]|uniref:transporter substrate-binding domain-containing protein n=1 Tax=Streptomyces sp. TS71-3 TaxID=2733862 RepID=UPI001B1587DD|nr:transporter substrate-binding domain-containing protein [Streptomyces sp. TS71-3]GHJ39258.1 amino acid-binding protein [Streptomyces sp. TS71-3]